jgi:hypothetical protein
VKQFSADYTGREQCGSRTPRIEAGVVRIGDLRTAVGSSLGLSGGA